MDEDLAKLLRIVQNHDRKKKEEFNRLSPDEKVRVLREENDKLRRRIRELREELETLKHEPLILAPTTIQCHDCDDGRTHSALLLISSEGEVVRVKCNGGCGICTYSDE